MQRSCAERIRQMHAQLRPADRKMHNLAQRRITQLIWRKRIRRLRNLLRRRPCAHPMRCGRSAFCAKHGSSANADSHAAMRESDLISKSH